MKNVLQIKDYVFIHLERSFSMFGRFLQQKTKSFHKIITFVIFMKNGGSSVDLENQPLNSDWAKKLTKKDTKIIFFPVKAEMLLFPILISGGHLDTYCTLKLRVNSVKNRKNAKS